MNTVVRGAVVMCKKMCAYMFSDLCSDKKFPQNGVNMNAEVVCVSSVVGLFRDGIVRATSSVTSTRSISLAGGAYEI